MWRWYSSIAVEVLSPLVVHLRPVMCVSPLAVFLLVLPMPLPVLCPALHLIHPQLGVRMYVISCRTHLYVECPPAHTVACPVCSWWRLLDPRLGQLPQRGVDGKLGGPRRCVFRRHRRPGGRDSDGTRQPLGGERRVHCDGVVGRFLPRRDGGERDGEESSSACPQRPHRVCRAC